MNVLLKRYTTFGLRRAAAEVSKEFRLMRRHYAGLKRARTLSLPADAKLQLGSGGQPKHGWINIDLYAAAADLTLDLREDLPFPDDSIAFIYSEHVFEHFAYPTDAEHILQECLRVLKPAGGFSVVIPHFGEALQAYVRGDESFFVGAERVRSYLSRERPTLMHHVNYWFRQDGLHRYAYDEETLGQVLRNAGFENVRARVFDPTIDSDKRHAMHSLYMEGSKPGASRSSRPAATELLARR